MTTFSASGESAPRTDSSPRHNCAVPVGDGFIAEGTLGRPGWAGPVVRSPCMAIGGPLERFVGSRQGLHGIRRVSEREVLGTAALCSGCSEKDLPSNQANQHLAPGSHLPGESRPGSRVVLMAGDWYAGVADEGVEVELCLVMKKKGSQNYNSAYLRSRAFEEAARSHRDGQPFSIAFLDIDYFKSVNDCYGHFCGDESLRRVAAAIRQSVRQGDVPSRYGGDEFIILLPGCNRESAASALDRVQASLASPFVVDGVEIHLSTSGGVAAFPEDGGDLDSLLSSADRRMYTCKSRAR